MPSLNDDLDAEGIPDLDQALPGDQTENEAMIPPGDREQARDERDTVDQRLRAEVPDRIRHPADAARIQDPETADDEDGSDWQAELGDEGGAPSAEEAAIHVRRRPTYAIDNPRDSYTGERLTEEGDAIDDSE